MRKKLIMLLAAISMFSTGCGAQSAQTNSEAVKESVEEKAAEEPAESAAEEATESVVEEPAESAAEETAEETEEEQVSNERQEIEITLDNWKEYFEEDIKVDVAYKKNAFDEVQYFNSFVGLMPKKEYQDRINFIDSFNEAFSVKLKFKNVEKEVSLDENGNVVLGENLYEDNEETRSFDFSENALYYTIESTGENMFFIVNLLGSNSSVMYYDSIELIDIVGKVLVLD